MELQTPAVHTPEALSTDDSDSDDESTPDKNQGGLGVHEQGATSEPTPAAPHTDGGEHEDREEDDDTNNNPKRTHTRFRRLIEQHEKKLRKGQMLLTDTTAANTIIDLKALHQHNDLRLKHHGEITSLRASLLLGLHPKYGQHWLKLRLSKIHPAFDASNAVAS